MNHEYRAWPHMWWLLPLALLVVVAGCSAATPSVSSPTPATGAAPPILHTVQGREACLVCHFTGIASSPQVPEHHRGRSNESCILCHQPAGARPAAAPMATPSPPSPPTLTPIPPPTPAAAPTLTPTPTLAATPAPMPTAAPTATPIVTPSRIPHPVAGRDACLACHASGSPGISQIPADHQGRGEPTCILCHQGP